MSDSKIFKKYVENINYVQYFKYIYKYIQIIQISQISIIYMYLQVLNNISFKVSCFQSNCMYDHDQIQTTFCVEYSCPGSVILFLNRSGYIY